MPIKGKLALAYVAGIVDGEGCICITTGKRVDHKRGYTTYLKVDVSNTNEWLIRWLKLSYGGYIGKRRAKALWKISWRWEIHHQKAADFLELILPYLQIKRPQAELAIFFQRAKRRGVGLTDEEAAIQEAQRLLMGKYNKKGKEETL